MRYSLVIFGIALIVWVFSTLDLSRLKGVLLAVKPDLLAGGLALIIVSILVRAIRHYYIAERQGIGLSFCASLVLFMQSSFWGFISPGRVGDFSRIYYHRRLSIGFQKSVANVILDRVFDLLSIVSIVSVAALMVDLPDKNQMLIVIVIILASGTVLAAITKWFMSESRSGSGLIGEVFMEVWGLDRKTAIVMLSLFAWSVYYAGMFLWYRSISSGGGIAFVVFAVGASNLLSIVPVSVCGIGTRDALLIYLFKYIDEPSETAVAFSALFVLAYIFQLLVSGAFVLLCSNQERCAKGSEA